jgi:hypothetical protein
MLSKQRIVNAIHLTPPPFGVGCNRVHYYSGHYWPTASALDDDKCEAIGGMRGRGNQGNRSESAPVPFCPPQIPHDLTWALIPRILQNVY